MLDGAPGFIDQKLNPIRRQDHEFDELRYEEEHDESDCFAPIGHGQE